MEGEKNNFESLIFYGGLFVISIVLKTIKDNYSCKQITGTISAYDSNSG